MDSRSLNKRVTIKALTAGQDDIGQPMRDWADFCKAWANILYKTGAEVLRGDKEASIVQASIRIRRRSDITAAMRVYAGAVIFEIKAVLPDETSRDHLDLACEVING